jgi:hypothetical protein
MESLKAVILACAGQHVQLSQRVGCFKDDPTRRDLPNEVTGHDGAFGSVENCVQACAKRYFMYADYAHC